MGVLFSHGCRCGLSARLLEERGLEKEPWPALAGLPAQVKVLAEMDSVVPLEELAMRFLHRVQQQPTGVSAGGLRVLKALLRKPAGPPPQLLSAMSRCSVGITGLLLGLDENSSGSWGSELLQAG